MITCNIVWGVGNLALFLITHELCGVYSSIGVGYFMATCYHEIS